MAHHGQSLLARFASCRPACLQWGLAEGPSLALCFWGQRLPLLLLQGWPATLRTGVYEGPLFPPPHPQQPLRGGHRTPLLPGLSLIIIPPSPHHTALWEEEDEGFSLLPPPLICTHNLNQALNNLVCSSGVVFRCGLVLI